MGGQWLILLSLVLGVSSSLPFESRDLRSYYCDSADYHSHCIINGRSVCAPDDCNVDCRTNPRFRAEHVLPDEWELMLDSHDYQNLLQDSSPAWIERDIDRDGGKWTQRGGICQYDLRACSYARRPGEPQNNWIFTQHIKYPIGNLPCDVFLKVTFRFSQCSSNPACRNDYVTLYRFDTNSIVPTSTLTNPAKYIPLFGPGTETTDSRLQQVGTTDIGVVRSFETSGNYAGFHLGIRDTGTCGQVKRIFLYYKPCKELLDGLVYYLELVRPPASSPNPCYTAEACCAPNAHSTTSLTYRACNDGRCERNVRCECDPGYVVDATGKECNCCPAGTYRSLKDPQVSCLACPKNTVTDLRCAPICSCIDGYYRKSNEGPGVDCTRAPTAVRDLRVNIKSDTSVIITWNRPEIIGRDDFYYIIKYTDIANFEDSLSNDPLSFRLVDSASTVSFRLPSIGSGLELKPNTDYIIKVIVHNGVSDQEPENEPLRKRDISVKTKEGVPSVPLGVRSLPGVVVWGPPAHPNGDITRYDVRFCDSSQCLDIIAKKPSESYHIVSDDYIADLGSNIRVQIRAKTSAGVGLWSDTQDYVPSCRAFTLPPPPLTTPPPPPGIVLELSSSIYTCDEGDSVISIIIIKTGVTLFDIDVIINLTDGTALGGFDYGPFPVAKVNITHTVPASSSESQFGIQVIEDSIVESMESFTVEIFLAPNQPGVVIGTVNRATILIIDNDMQCLTLPNPSNGLVSVTTKSGGSIARYSCSPGFTLVVVQCPALTSPANGRVSVSSRLEDGVARYSCFSGYSVIGTSTRTCQSDGSWSGQQPRCVQCPALTSPANGRVSVPSRLVNRGASYSCLSGYSLIGTPTRTCQSSGSWSGQQPRCVQCPALTSPANGRVLVPSRLVGGVARYSCSQGFSLTGSSSRTCLSTGRWNGVQPTCQPEGSVQPECQGVQCPTLTSPTNGRVSFSSRLVGSIARYSCSPGFTLTGSVVRSCQTPGRWNGTQPECRPSSEDVHFSLNGRVYQNGSRIVISDIGEVDSALYCVTSSTACCSNPKAGNFYYPNGAAVQYGDAGVYRTRTDQAVRLNLRNSALVTPGRYVCEIPDSRRTLRYINIFVETGVVQCPTLTSPANGRVSVSSRLEDGVARYSCFSGYSLIGTSTRTCQSDGSWSGQQPRCVQCPILTSPANGRVSVPSRLVDRVASYSCFSGYSLIGTSTRTCQFSGSWSGQQPRCVLQCPALTSPANGRVSVTSRSVGGVASYLCSQGFSLAGSSSRSCLSTGRWNGLQPTCQLEVVQCPALNRPANGRVTVSSRSVGGVASYSCLSGYSRIGTSTRTCQSDGSWSGQQPRCSEDDVHFSLNGRVYQNGSRVVINDIGEDTSALHCVTSSTSCCLNPKAGNFYYPNGAAVQYSDAGVYRTRTDQAVRLNLRNSAQVTPGRYVCEIPDSRGILKNTSVEIIFQCPTNLPNPSNGLVSVIGGSIARYLCSPGFTLVGSSTRRCLSSGTWSDSAPSCEGGVQCPLLSNPANGQVSVSSRFVGGIATYSCSQGFTRVGTVRRICLATGNWNGAQPECQSSEDVHFSLNGRVYQDGSRVVINDIGEVDSALYCVTSSTTCCSNPKAGNFYYPNGAAVQYGDPGVYRTRTDQAVRLNLRNSASFTPGRYVCEIPDSSGTLRYISIFLETGGR